MENILSHEERNDLRILQRKSGDKNSYVKVTVLLLLDKGKSPQSIADDLGISVSSVFRYQSAYLTDGLEIYLSTNYSGRWGFLSCHQLSHLRQELNSRLFTTSEEVIDFIQGRFGISYSASGVTAMLHRIGYSYKQTTPVPCEADQDKQQAFLDEVLPPLIEQAKAGEAVVYYVDGVHPTHNTRSTHAWIETGNERPLPTVSGRDRVNLNGALNALEPTDIQIIEAERINAQSTQQLYEKLMAKHPEKKIIVIQDNARYYRNKALKEWLIDQPIEQVFLPPYSPNLNLIERLWKFLRKKVINAHFFRTKQVFRQAVLAFFQHTSHYAKELNSLLTLNFHILDYQS